MEELPLDILRAILDISDVHVSILRLVCVLFESMTRERFVLSPGKITSREALMLRSKNSPTEDYGGGIVLKDIRGIEFNSKEVIKLDALWRGQYKAQTRGTRPINRVWTRLNSSLTQENVPIFLKLPGNTYIPDDDTVKRILIARASRLGIIMADRSLVTLLDQQVIYYQQIRSRMKFKD